MAKATDTTSAAARREPRASIVAGWSPERIRSAEIACAGGNFATAADLCESMMSDERVSKCLDRLYAAVTLPLTFQLPGKNSEQSKNDPICQALDADFWKIFPEQQMRTLVAWVSMMRVALGHVDGWRVDPETGRAIPVISIWSNRNLRNDAQLGWMVQSASPGSGYSIVEEQAVPGDGNWIIFVAGSNYRAAYQAPWRGIARWWLLKLYAQVDWASSSERHGQGQVFVSNTLTAGSSGLEADVGEEISGPRKTQLAQDIANCGRNGVLVLPRGWKAELVTDGAKTFETFERQTAVANSAIDMALIGTNLTSEVSGNGSRAAAQVHESVDASKLRGLLELIATTSREQLFVRWTAFNFAKGVSPYPHWDTTPPRDLKAEAEARKADADALKTYREAGAQLNQKAWFNGEVKLLDTAGEEFPEPKPVPPAASSPLSADDDETEPEPVDAIELDEDELDIEPKPAPRRPKTKGALALASGDVPDTAFRRGRAYTDKLEANCCKHAAVDLAPTLASVLAALASSSDFEDAKQRLMDAYRNEAVPVDLLERTEKALIMGQLAGAETIEQELEE